jgi:hypothetical protein
MVVTSIEESVMSKWHPPVETADQWRAHYERWRDIHGPNSVPAHPLRRSIVTASESDRLSDGQRKVLLGALTQINDEGRGR